MPVHNGEREMPFISEENARKYYDELLNNYHYETDLLYTKIPTLKSLMEHHILKEVTGKNEFKIHFNGEPSGQWKWLFDRKEVITNYETSGSISQDLIAGIEHLFKARNEAEHKQKAKPAGYLGHFCTVAETIEEFSGVPIPREVQDILFFRNIADGHSPISDAPLGELEEELRKCTKCGLPCNTIKVLGNGCSPSKVMFIAKAPGNFQDRSLLVHDQTGKNFGELLKHIRWERKNIFITNAVLCHFEKNPPERPNKTDIKRCKPYLERIIDLVKPEVVVPLGEDAFYAINAISEIEDVKPKFGDNVAQRKDWITKDWITIEGKKIKVFPLYLPHPQNIVKNSENDEKEEQVIPAGKRTWGQFVEDFEELARLVGPIKELKNH